MSGYVVIADKAENEQAWLDAHDEGVSATEVATLIRGGAGAWSALRAQKNGHRKHVETPAMRHGTEREPVIAEFARAVFGLEPCSLLVGRADNPLYRASPDALSADGLTVGEFKTTSHDWDEPGDVPARYWDQMQWQMFVTGAVHGVLVFEPHEGFVPLYPFPKHFNVEYDPERCAELIRIADEFMAGGEADAVSAELDDLLVRRVAAKRRADAASAEVSSLDAEIRTLAAAAGRERFEGSEANLTLSPDSTRKSFSSSAFKKADPDTYEKYVVEQPVKGRLTITERNA